MAVAKRLILKEQSVTELPSVTSRELWNDDEETHVQTRHMGLPYICRPIDPKQSPGGRTTRPTFPGCQVRHKYPYVILILPSLTLSWKPTVAFLIQENPDSLSFVWNKGRVYPWPPPSFWGEHHQNPWAGYFLPEFFVSRLLALQHTFPSHTPAPVSLGLGVWVGSRHD